MQPLLSCQGENEAALRQTAGGNQACSGCRDGNERVTGLGSHSKHWEIPCHPAGPDSDFHWMLRRLGGVNCRDAFDVGSAVRCLRERPAHLRDCPDAARDRRIGRLFHPRPVLPRAFPRANAES